MGVLNKKYSWYRVPDNVNYYKRAKSDLWLFVGVLAAIGCIVMLASCSTAYKVRKSYEKAAAYSPITAKDSLNAIKIGKKVIKEKPPKLIPGKTIKVPVKSIVKVKDTTYINNLVDSFENAMEKDANDIAQGCLDDVTAAQSKYYKKGFNDGYKKGLSEFPSDSIDITTPDTPIPVDEELSFDYSQCQLTLRTTQADLIATKAKLSTFKFLFWILLGGIIFGLLIGVLIKRSNTKLSK